MFWSLGVPSAVYSGEPDDHALVRARLMSAIEDANVESSMLCIAMHQVTGTVFGNSAKWTKRAGVNPDGWSVEACGASLPNTHWHILRRGSIWMGWRVHQAIWDGQGPRSQLRWETVGAEVRRRHLRQAVATSPVSGTIIGLIDELTLQGQGRTSSGTDRELPPNTYAFGELHGIELTLGSRHPDAAPGQVMAGLGGFREARALTVGAQRLLPEPSARFPWRPRRRVSTPAG